LRRLVSVLLAALLLLASSPADAVMFGEPDGTAHPYVGLVVFYDSDGTATHRCTGTLLSSTVLLTAGHCTSGTASAQVWFDPIVTREAGYPYSGGITGTTYTMPCYNDFASFPNTCDIGIVVLDQPYKVKGGYPTLAPVGTLDSLATKRGQQSTTFTIVGYGLQGVKPDFSALRERYRAEVSLINLTSALTGGYNIQVTSNPGNKTSGGLCFGDSGGAVFYGNTIVAVNSFVLNGNCRGSGFAYRTDTQAAYDFITSFLK